MVVALVGVSFASIFIRWSESTPLVIAAYRMLLVSLILLPFALRFSPGEIRSMGRRDLVILLVIGVLLAAHFYGYVFAVKNTSVANAILLASWHPVLVGILAFIWLRETSREVAMGITIGMVGMVLIVAGDVGEAHLLGDLAALVSGIFFAGYLLLGRVLRQRISLITYAFLVFASCAVCLLLAAIIVGETLWPVEARELLLFLALAVVSTIFGHMLFNYSLRYLSAPVVSVTYLGEPVGAIILASLLLSEYPTPFAVLGGGMVMAGILLTTCLGGRIRRRTDRKRGPSP